MEGDIFITAVTDQCVCLVHTVGSTNPILSPSLPVVSFPHQKIPNSVLKAQFSALFSLVSTLGRVFSKLNLNLVFFFETQPCAERFIQFRDVVDISLFFPIHRAKIDLG